MHTLPITEKEISQWTDLPVYAPVLCANLNSFGINTAAFVNFYKDCFKQMPWDLYDVKRKQWAAIPEEMKFEKEALFRTYYINNAAAFNAFIDHFDLDEALKNEIQAIQPWRRRSVCSFELDLVNDIEILRVPTIRFEQQLGSTDIRSLPRVFEETKAALVENDLFFQLLKAVAQYAQKVTPHVNIKKIKMAVHFMSVKAQKDIPGNNAPEGSHEDGADFIISALVVNRQNISGGKSQVIEKMADATMPVIFEHELQPGEFLFQADTGEEKHYGNDLWHYVTPFYLVDETKEAWRDIIGLDVVVDQPKI